MPIPEVKERGWRHRNKSPVRRRVTCWDTTIHGQIQTYGQFKDPPKPNPQMIVFLGCQRNSVPGGKKQRRRGENIETPTTIYCWSYLQDWSKRSFTHAHFSGLHVICVARVLMQSVTEFNHQRATCPYLTHVHCFFLFSLQ